MPKGVGYKKNKKKKKDKKRKANPFSFRQLAEKLQKRKKRMDERFN